MRMLFFIALLLPALAIAPALADGQAHLASGNQLLEENKPAEAIAHYSQAIESGDLSQDDLAQAHWKRGVAEFDHNLDDLHIRHLDRIDGYENCLADLEKAVSYDVSLNAEFHRQRGQCREYVGPREDAIPDFLAVLDLEEKGRNRSLAVYALGILYKEQRDAVKAQFYLNNCIANGDPESRMTKGCARELDIVTSQGENIDALSSEKAELANKMLAFVDHMETKHFDTLQRLNGNADVEERFIEFDNAKYNIRVARGDVIEKAGFTTSVTKKGIQPYTQDAIWGRVVTINIHAKSPFTPYLHAFVSFQYNTDGGSSIGGWMGLVPAVRVEEDLTYVKDSIDAIFDKVGRNPDGYRNALCSGQRKAHDVPACVGVSFYAPPFLDITEENYDLVVETFETLFDSYIEILEKRKDQAVTEQDLAAQDIMRRKWLEDQMMYDPYAQNVIRHDVRSFANYPPLIKY